MTSGSKPIVKCSVADCVHWGEKNICQAESIMIDIDQNATRQYHAEFAGESFDSENQTKATTSSATCCHTFKPKSK
ncbi:MAG TPA: DUF1540 domain-containing protein [Paenibacillus sp.]|jgi:hypothetical protein